MSQKFYESVVCPGCACLCDDIDLAVEDNRVVSVANVCTWGITKFIKAKKFHHRKERHRLGRPLVRGRRGVREVSYQVAMRRAAELLARSPRTLIYGLTHCSYAAQELGVQLARRLHGRLAPGDGGLLYHFNHAFRQHGALLLTLEEIRDQADLLIFWGGNPVHSCPRLPARYGIFARGRFTERGFEDRRAFSVDLRPTEMETMSQMVLLPEGGDLETLEAVEQLLAGEKPAASSGRLKQLGALVEAIAAASTGVIFCGRGVLYGGQPERLLARLLRLSHALAHRLPLALLPLATDYNSWGLAQVLLREDGLGGEPELLTSDIGSWDLTGVDAILAVGGDLWWFLTEEQRQVVSRRRMPIISVSAFADRTTTEATVALPAAIIGVEAEGVAYRMDGVPLALTKVVASPYPADHEILAGIGAYL